MCLKPLKWDKAENYRESQYLDYESEVDGLKCSKRSNKGSFVTGTRRGITSLEFSIAFKICDVWLKLSTSVLSNSPPLN